MVLFVLQEVMIATVFLNLGIRILVPKEREPVIVIAHAKGSHITTMFRIILRITNHVHYVLCAPTPKPMNCYLHRAVYKNAILHSMALILK